MADGLDSTTFTPASGIRSERANGATSPAHTRTVSSNAGGAAARAAGASTTLNPALVGELSRTMLFKVGLIGLLFVLIYYPNLQRLWIKTNWFTGDANWAHSMCIPLIGIYYLFLRRDELAATPVRPVLPMNLNARRSIICAALAVVGIVFYLIIPAVMPQTPTSQNIAGVASTFGIGLMIFGPLALLLDWGLATLVGGLLMSAYGIYPGRNDYLWDCGMLMTLFGIVLTLGGYAVMRIAAFPILFGICALPWPGLVYSWIALPLQMLAARFAVVIMQLTGIQASFSGTKIFIPQFTSSGTALPARALNVEEACAGLVSLMSFISIAAAVAFLSSRPLWQKLVITLSAIPIAIGCNVLRVGGVGVLDTYVGRQWSEGFAHQFAGMILLLPAFFLIMLVCWIVDGLFLEEVDDSSLAPPSGVEVAR